jgi:alkylhydroperoxidase family enzyme
MRAHTASSKRHGVSEEQIRALNFFRRSAAFDEKEKATLLYAERVTRGAAALRDGSLEELKRYYTEDQIVELTLTICIANFTNRFNDALQADPDLGSATV